jgi:hypothetical protein
MMLAKVYKKHNSCDGKFVVVYDYEHHCTFPVVAGRGLASIASRDEIDIILTPPL